MPAPTSVCRALFRTDWTCLGLFIAAKLINLASNDNAGQGNGATIRDISRGLASLAIRLPNRACSDLLWEQNDGYTYLGTHLTVKDLIRSAFPSSKLCLGSKGS
jgi:hypothetical protein